MEPFKTEEIKEIWYDNGMQPFPVYKIPFDKLIYNKFNGRIKSIVKSFEAGLNRVLDPTNETDASIIETFLYDSAASRNERTIQSLRDYGQQEIGIVTKDMIIIDGNRRASLLKRIYKTDKLNAYFKAIILPHNLADNTLDIIKLETNYQMGVDNKVEYNPIEKYLRCKELKYDFHIDQQEIAKLMSEKPQRIQQWLDILSLMEEYLIYLGSPNIYTRLDKKEGHFVDLHNYLKKYQALKIDIQELKLVYFDYIRLGLPVQRIRVIGNPNNSMSLFAKKEYWSEFYKEHLTIKTKLIENNFQELKENNPNKSNEEIFTKLDYDYQNSLQEPLIANLIAGEIYIKTILEKKSILKELNDIQKFLSKLEPNNNVLTERIEIIALLDSIIECAIKLKEKFK